MSRVGATDGASLVQVIPTSGPKLGAFQLMVMGFFWVSGGIYGNEEMMLTSRPEHVLPALVITPFIYSLPLMLVIAELSSAMPWTGGSLAWTAQACGRKLGAQNAFWTWTAYSLDASVYPRLAAGYLATTLRLDRSSRVLLALILVALSTVVRLIGVQSTVRFTQLLCVLTLAPSFIFIGAGLPHVDWQVLSNHSGNPTDWPMTITWLVWLYSGVFSFGAVAKEVERPEVTYVIVCVVVLGLDVILVNFTPLLISLSLDPNRANYETGHFAALGETLVGRWLGVFMTVGALIAQIGLYNSSSFAADRYLYTILRPALFHTQRRVRFSTRRAGPVSKFMFSSQGTGLPRVISLLNAAMHLGLCVFAIEVTIPMSMVFGSLSYILLAVSYVWLKIKQPHLPRKYTIPGGKLGGAMCVLPLAVGSIVNISSSALKFRNAIFIVVILVVGFLLDKILGLGTGVDELDGMAARVEEVPVAVVSGVEMVTQPAGVGASEVATNTELEKI